MYKYFTRSNILRAYNLGNQTNQTVRTINIDHTNKKEMIVANNFSTKYLSVVDMHKTCVFCGKKFLYTRNMVRHSKICFIFKNKNENENENEIK